MEFRPTFYEHQYEKTYTSKEWDARQRQSQNAFTTDILQGEYGDIWKDTLTEWGGKGADTSVIKTQIVLELTSNENMKKEMIEKAVLFGVYFRWSYLKDRNENEDKLKSLKVELVKTFDSIKELMEVGVEDVPIAWNSLKKYSKKSFFRDLEWDTRRAKNDDEDIRRAIAKKTAANFVDSEYYKKKLEAWVAVEGNKEKKKVKKKIVDELKNDLPMSIDVIAYAIKQTDNNYTLIYTDDSVFDQVFFYIFNSIATVLAKGATNTRSAWTTLKNNENEKIHGVYCFDVKAAIKSIVLSQSAPVSSDPMDIDQKQTHVAALLQLLRSYI
jgi:hypothetical protein